MTVELSPHRAPRPAAGAKLAAAAAAVVLAWTVAHAAADRTPVRTRLRARVAEAVRARFPEAQVGDASVDWAFRVCVGPVVVPARRAGTGPVIRVAEARIRPDWLALLRGRAEPGAVLLRGVRIAPGAGGEDLRAALARRAPAAASPPAPAHRTGAVRSIRFEDLALAWPARGRVVEVGPLDGVVRRAASDADETLSADVWFPGGGRATLDVRREPAGIRAHLHAGGLGPQALPAALRDGAVAVDAGVLSIDVRAEGPADASRLAVRARLAAERVVLRGERLADAPVGPLSVQADGDLDVDLVHRRATLRGGEVRLQHAIRVAAEGEVRLGPGIPFSLAVHADDVEWAAAVASLPAALQPPATAPRPAGPVSFRLDLAGPLPAPAEWTVHAALDLARAREAARRAPPVPLRAEFAFHPDDGPAVVVGPRNPGFVPIGELPEHVVRAVTTSEDAGFFAHEGFDFDELRNAVVEGAEAGRVVRGGSTITQQLAKNLYLSREKTFARKIREACATIGLEATVPKARLLEIYLAVAEWGPGVRGIGAAARHWFGKDARALTPKEAAFLASVIPNPVRYHAMFARGEVPEFWEERVDGILLRLEAQGVLTRAQLDEALAEPIVFARG